MINKKVKYLENKKAKQPKKYRYAFVITQNGGEIISFTIPIKTKKISKIKDEVKKNLNIDKEIVEIVTFTSPKRIIKFQSVILD